MRHINATHIGSATPEQKEAMAALLLAVLRQVLATGSAVQALIGRGELARSGWLQPHRAGAITTTLAGPDW